MLSVKYRQMNLKFLGYYKNAIDGIEGVGTKQAYRDFQKDFGLAVDGVYGANTNAKLIEVIKEEQRKLGVSQDGIAGQVTTNARNNNGHKCSNPIVSPPLYPGYLIPVQKRRLSCRHKLSFLRTCPYTPA